MGDRVKILFGNEKSQKTTIMIEDGFVEDVLARGIADAKDGAEKHLGSEVEIQSMEFVGRRKTPNGIRPGYLEIVWVPRLIEG